MGQDGIWAFYHLDQLQPKYEMAQVIYPTTAHEHPWSGGAHEPGQPKPDLGLARFGLDLDM